MQLGTSRGARGTDTLEKQVYGRYFSTALLEGATAVQGTLKFHLGLLRREPWKTAQRKYPIKTKLESVPVQNSRLDSQTPRQ